MKAPAIESAVHTTPPIIIAAVIPPVPVRPALTSTSELRISVISVMPDTGFVPTIAIAFAATVAGVMIVLNRTYGFVGEGALVAPQANAMAAVIKPLMEGGATPWMLYLAGAALALILTMIGVPALAFALGMFIPLELNTPLLIGGLVSWWVGSRSRDERTNRARRERGTLIASGFIAGGALMGVVSALLRYFGADWFASSWNATSGAEILAVVMYVAIIGYFIWDSLRAKPEVE